MGIRSTSCVLSYNEHVSFAATNPIENGGAECEAWPKSSLENPEARKRNCPRKQSENRSVALCQVVRGSRLTTTFFITLRLCFYFL